MDTPKSHAARTRLRRAPAFAKVAADELAAQEGAKLRIMQNFRPNRAFRSKGRRAEKFNQHEIKANHS
jgi:hypothetical protein